MRLAWVRNCACCPPQRCRGRGGSDTRPPVSGDGTPWVMPICVGAGRGKADGYRTWRTGKGCVRRPTERQRSGSLRRRCGTPAEFGTRRAGSATARIRPTV